MGGIHAKVNGNPPEAKLLISLKASPLEECK